MPFLYVSFWLWFSMWFLFVNISLTCSLFSASHVDVPPSSGHGQVWDCEMVWGLQSRPPRLSGVWAPGPVSHGLCLAESRPHSASDADQRNSTTGKVGPQPQHNCTVVALETKHIVVFYVSWLCLIVYKTLRPSHKQTNTIPARYFWTRAKALFIEENVTQSFAVLLGRRLPCVALLWCHDAYVAAAAIAIRLKPRPAT